MSRVRMPRATGVFSGERIVRERVQQMVRTFTEKVRGPNDAMPYALRLTNRAFRAQSRHALRLPAPLVP